LSIHGIQKFFPFALSEEFYHLESPIDFLIGINEIVKNKKQNEKIKIISRLAWPIILIHGTGSSHIVVDDVGISNFSMNITNPPRKGVIGHILRNMDNRTYIELLDRIIGVITYKDTEEKIILEKEKDEEKREFRNVSIKGLLPPSFIKCLEILVNNIYEAPISEYNLLESQYSYELGLDFAQEFQKLITDVKGTKIQWNDLKKVIQEPFENWMNELNAQIKNAELKLKSSISKEKSSLTDEQADELIKKYHQDMEQFALKEKKNVLEKIGGAFLPIDMVLEKLRQKNAEFINTDSYKTLHIEVAIAKASEHINYIKTSIADLNQKWSQLWQSFNEYLEKIKQIDIDIKKQIQDKELEIRTQIAQRNSRIEAISKQSLEFISQLKNAKDTLNKKLAQIFEIIENKMKACDKEIGELYCWGLDEQKSNIAQAVIRLFIPVFAGLLSDEVNDEERIIFCFPIIVNKKLESKEILNGFVEFKQKVEQVISQDMKIRSNFEFTMAKHNLLTDPKLESNLNEAERILRSLKYEVSNIVEKIRPHLK